MKLTIKLIAIYQRYISQALHLLVGVNSACRYYPSCSEFAKEVILEEGLLRGGRKALFRILSCQPLKFSAENFTGKPF